MDERDEHLMLLEAARQALEVEWTETLAVAEDSADHDVMGYPSSVAYLKDQLAMAGGRAHRLVKTARSASKFEATFSAWKHRQISGDEAELLFKTSEKMPKDYSEAENDLLELVGDGFDDTKKIIDYWRTGVDRSNARLDLEEQMERRRFDVTKKPNGMVAGDFLLGNLEGEAFLTAIDALMPPPSLQDERTTTQRRADALGDLARGFLDGSETPTVGGERPHINVHVDLPSLQGMPGELHETADGAVLDPILIDQINCDASVARIVFGPDSEVLDVGRRTRTVPAGLRRAVVARDRHCVAPGCSRSAKWCDVHHRLSWADGGDTVLQNLCLLCRYHHTLIHLNLLTLEDQDASTFSETELSARST